MTAPEAGSGRADDDGDATPVGWRRLQGADDEHDVLKLDPRHPKYPGEWRAAHQTEAFGRLDQDPGVAAAVQRLRALYAALAPRFRDRLRSAIDPEDTERAVYDLGRDVALPLEAEARAGPAAIPITTRIAYLADRALPKELAGLLPSPLSEPIMVLANRGETVFPLRVYHGEIVVKFSGIAARDIDKRIGRFITEAEGHLGHDTHRRKGGAQRLQERPNKRAAVVRAAKLRYWNDASPASIARDLGLVRRGESGTERHVQQQVQRWIHAGDAAMTEDHGPDWKDQRERIEGAGAGRNEH